ncbi:glycosyltransferase family 4 protein [Occallatibacter riparius]|uniref:Glycosyltransferase family 4 protein n=1 Tax=Occallatibacter riparius TaxID=1002689 RepID=A0A9J7BRK4_9BACT|nr:glycosyltransferase family 4 protein [Occallatibacter riparius]UWZ85516.1 glycosyltransferase family 4 protein [Occallatibacter riparius]
MLNQWEDRIRPVIVVVGHCGIPTGFSRVLRQIVIALRDAGFELHHFAINLVPDSPIPDWPCPVICNPAPGDLHNAAELAAIIESLHPDVVLMMDEPWACARLMTAFTLHPEIRTVLYVAIHGRDSLPPAIATQLGAADRLVAFTPQAERLLRDALEAGGESPQFATIPHGVDTQAFYPLIRRQNGDPSPDRVRHARQLLFADRPELADGLIVLNANRNQPFKRIDLALEGFARFAQGKPPNVRMYLHLATRPALPDEVTLVDRLGLRDRILPKELPEKHPHADDRWLNLLYNACDIGMNTSQREGWGLVSFEHAATGAPQMVPNHSAGAELWPGSALMLDTEQHKSKEDPQFEGDVRIDSVSEALEMLYQNKSARYEMSLSAYRLATDERFQWKSIGETWSNLLCTLLES